MPSPFPGMDPYLESSEFWRGFHSSMIPTINAQLNRTLPPGFAAFIEERIYVIVPDNNIIPDVVVTRQPTMAINPQGRSAVLERRADASETISYYPDREHELFVEVRRSGSRQGEVVAAIELLSPSNKISGGRGRQEYESKQQELLESETHLLEIDLLREGAHTVAAPRSAILTNGSWDYLICLHRAGERNTFEIWRNVLAHRLPIVKVPLTAEQPDAILDLQEAFDSTYDTGPYRRVLDYRQEPNPPLSEATAKWADGLLHEKGFRT